VEQEEQVEDVRETAVRGVRGATTVPGAAAVDDAVGELVREIEARNGLRPEDVAAAIFTVTGDLAGSNPARAARLHGWGDVALLAVREHGGDSPLPRCVRVLVLWNTPKPQADVRHVYLREAATLRPDLDPLAS
jgi:chorismate mutase